MTKEAAACLSLLSLSLLLPSYDWLAVWPILQRSIGEAKTGETNRKRPNYDVCRYCHCSTARAAPNVRTGASIREIAERDERERMEQRYSTYIHVEKTNREI